MGRQKQTKPAASTSGGRGNLLPPYQPGQSGNPKGRPVAARQRLTEKFISDLSAHYEKEGANLITRVSEQNPEIIIQLIARLLPKDVAIQITQHSSMTLEQQRRIAEAWIIAQADTDAIESDYVVQSQDVIESAALPAELPLLPGRVDDAPAGEVRDGVDEFEKPNKPRRTGLDRV